MNDRQAERIITVFGSSRPKEGDADVELGHPAPWGEASGRMVRVAGSQAEAVSHLAVKLGR